MQLKFYGQTEAVERRQNKAQQLSKVKGEQKEAFEKIVRGHDTFSSVLKTSKTSQRKKELGSACGRAELLAEHWIDGLEIEGYKIQYRQPSWIWRVIKELPV